MPCFNGVEGPLASRYCSEGPLASRYCSVGPESHNVPGEEGPGAHNVPGEEEPERHNTVKRDLGGITPLRGDLGGTY